MRTFAALYRMIAEAAQVRKETMPVTCIFEARKHNQDLL